MAPLELIRPKDAAGRSEERPSRNFHNHTVQFYEDDASVSDAAADFLVRGLSDRQSGVVIATPEHSAAIAAGMAAGGCDVGAALSEGHLRLLDAHATLAAFMVGDTPDRELFMATIGAVIGGLNSTNARHEIRAYGEMVDVLWKAGNTVAALRLEDLWNELIAQRGISLFCAYSMASFYRESDADGIREICDRHAHIIPVGQTPREQRVPDDELAMLRERARSYAAEVRQREQLEQRLRDTVIALQEREEEARSGALELERALDRERAARVEAERARADAQRAQSVAEQANRAKSEFLAVMSHELRTPLNAIGGYAEIMELGIHGPISPQQRDALERIQRSQRMLLGLINEVLNYARIETGNVHYEMADVPVGELLRVTEALLAPQLRAKGIRYECRACPTGLSCRADGDKLQQILLNLLTNALKFTDRGGTICVEPDAVESTVVIRIRDTGIGIAGDKLEQIFEPFVQVDAHYTRTRDGVGLGLAISRDLARGMGGELTVESVLGHGSVFTLKFARGA